MVQQVTDQANLPNEKPCPYEKEAAIAQLGLSSNLQSADALTLLFLVDGSGSVSADDFQEMKAFMAEAAANTSRTVKEVRLIHAVNGDENPGAFSLQLVPLDRWCPALSPCWRHTPATPE